MIPVQLSQTGVPGKTFRELLFHPETEGHRAGDAPASIKSRIVGKSSKVKTKFADFLKSKFGLQKGRLLRIIFV